MTKIIILEVRRYWLSKFEAGAALGTIIRMKQMGAFSINRF
jgi:hypothetical protein